MFTLNVWGICVTGFNWENTDGRYSCYYVGSTKGLHEKNWVGEVLIAT